MRVYILVPFALLLCQVGGYGQSQRPGGKPVLIRDEVDKRIEQEKVPVHDPEQARKSVEIGTFYQKRGNLKAAEERFREAIDFNMPWTEPYERLIALLEKAGRREEAVAICDLYVENNPGSAKNASFEKRKSDLVRKDSSR